MVAEMMAAGFYGEAMARDFPPDAHATVVSLREGALACGFLYASHCSRAWRAGTGATPYDYRRTFAS